MTDYKRVALALVVLAVAFIGAFGYAYVSYSSEVSTANELSTQNGALQRQLTSAQASITALNSQVVSLTAQIDNLTSIVNLKNSLLLLTPTSYTESAFGTNTSTNYQFVNYSDTESCCFINHTFRYSGFLNITLYSTNGTPEGKTLLEVGSTINGIQENLGVALVSTPQPPGGTFLSPGQSFIVPVLSGAVVPTIYITTFASVSVSETIGITYQY